MKNQIQICMGSSCFARGNESHLEIIERYLQRHGKTAEIDLRGSRCGGKCSEGPNLILNGVSYSHMEPEKLLELLKEHFRDENA